MSGNSGCVQVEVAKNVALCNVINNFDIISSIMVICYKMLHFGHCCELINLEDSLINEMINLVDCAF